MTARSASSTAPKDRGDPAGHCDDDERWALASVLGELGTGVFQVAGGAPGGTKQTRAVARELAARTGRPSIYNLMSDPIGNPDEWVEHLKWLEDGFKSGARCYGSALSTVAGAIFNLRARPQRAAGRGHHRSRRASSAACRPGTGSWRCPIRTGCAPSAIRRSARRCRPRRSRAPSQQQGGMTDRRGRARGSFNRRWDLVEVFMTDEGSEPPPRRQERRADRPGAEQEHHGCLPRPVARRRSADLLPDDRPQQRSGSAEAHPRLAIHGDRHQRRRRPAAHRRPARDQHASAGPLGARTAGDDAGRGGLSADRQDRADARHHRSRLYRGRQGRRHHDLRSRHDRLEAARAGRRACRRAASR